jgi:iron complex transport system permease protein
LLGSLAGARWDNLTLPAVVLAAGLVALLVQWRALNAISAGEDAAISLGVAAHRLRAQMFVLTSLLTGVLCRSDRGDRLRGADRAARGADAGRR